MFDCICKAQRNTEDKPFWEQRMTRTTDITTFSDMRQNLREHLDRVKKSGRPLFVTNNGKAEAVVLSAKAYDRILNDPILARSVASVQRGLKQRERGEQMPVDEMFDTISRNIKRRKRPAA
jgi:prevent-host-death family protein